jgi:hypothetical protein
LDERATGHRNENTWKYRDPNQYPKVVQPEVVVGIVIGYCWITEETGFESQYGQEFSLLHIVQTGSGVNSPSYSMGTEGSFHGGKAAWA